jgi:hypothetical protein
LSNTTTGSDRVIPDQQPPQEERGLRLARLTRPAVTHWQFTIVLAAAVVIRIIVILGYPPILWFNDSYNYIYDAVTHIPDVVRPNGYPFFIDLLLSLHSAYPLAILQAAMGVVIGVLIYALLRRRGLPWWGATLAALPVLFDSYQLHLEHMVTADTLFIFLSTVAIVILCWNDRPSVPVMAVAGLLIGYATLVRSVGQPLLAVVLVAMLVRRVGWRRLVTLLVAGVVPIVAYMIWFNSSHGRFGLTESSGTFLYSRVSTFAECDKIKPSADVRVLCDPTPPYLRPVSGEYLWADKENWPDDKVSTPLFNLHHSADNRLRFTPEVNKMAEKFAREAILAQPVSYLHVVINDTLHTFDWNRQPDPNNYYGNGPAFQFVSGRELNALIPWWVNPVRGDAAANRIYRARHEFAGPGLGNTQAVQPWQHLLQEYQRYFYLRGTLLGLIVLIGAAGVLARWRRWGGIGLLPWLVGALMIVLPPMTAGFSYRYVLARHLPGRRPGVRAQAGGQVSGRPGGRSAPAPSPRRRCRSGIASAACRGPPRRAPAPARSRIVPSRSPSPCPGPSR